VHEKNLPPGMAENIPWVLHSDWMTTIKYLSHSNSLITTSMDGNLLMLDFEKRHLKWSGKEHAHGIYSCDYCRSSLSTATSCSLDFMTSIDLQNASLKLFF
jgi:WD40 repeat protein